MRTWEMFVSLSGNPDREYRRISDGMKIWVDNDLKFRWKSGREFIAADDRWKQVREPVPFMLAFNKFKNEAKVIYCYFNGSKHEYYPLVKGNQQFDEDHIQYGEWYVKEE